MKFQLLDCTLCALAITICAVGAAQMSETLRGISKDCFVLDNGLETYTLSNASDALMYNMGDVDGDGGFELTMRRASDGLMTDGWFEPGREYRLELSNRMESVGFHDYILWLEPSTEEEEASRTGRTVSHAMTNKERRIMMLERIAKDRRRSRSRDTKTWRFENKVRSEVGRWVHLPPMALLRGGMGIHTGTTNDKLGCRGLVAQRNVGPLHPESVGPTWDRVLIKWQAPQAESTNLAETTQCVTIGAAVRTRGTAASLYSNIGGLHKVVCPNRMRPPNAVLPTDIMRHNEPKDDLQQQLRLQGQQNGGQAGTTEPGRMNFSQESGKVKDTMQPMDCCACGTATYNLTFQGIWSPETHPKDWPHDKPGLLHWTNLIGATHQPSYSIYRIGEPANAAVQAVCSYGDITVMKQTLSHAASNSKGISSVPTGSQRGSVGVGPLLSLITAPGMWNADTLMESRTLQMAVNRTHPVFSLITMLGPSADWCTGLSGQSLCRPDCSWASDLQFDLYPFDAGFRNGNTYIPKNSDRLDVPNPIRYITERTNPGNPFTPGIPVARVTLTRIKPEADWQCVNEPAAGVQMFTSDGQVMTVLTKEQMKAKQMMEMEAKPDMESKRRNKQPIQSVADLPGLLSKRRRGAPSVAAQSAGTAGSGGLGQDNPLSDPALANMATFLCKTSDWSAWSQCSVTCGIGQKTRSRQMLVNKKNELCQHLPLTETDSCEGRKRTCDFSAPCALLPWTNWSPCNATCENPNDGLQTRKRYLARPQEANRCVHLFETREEWLNKFVLDKKACAMTEVDCDPVSMCGEGRKDGVACGATIEAFHYSALEHACLPFPYLGCKGGKNRFASRATCEQICFPAVEALPDWRRERMVLLQYRTAQVHGEPQSASEATEMQPGCRNPMDPGSTRNATSGCDNNSRLSINWYYCSRTRRCREFVYNGCDGNENRFESYEACLQACMPEEVERSRRLSQARAAAQMRHTNTTVQQDDPLSGGSNVAPSSDPLGGQRQDCVLSRWGGWGPCSAPCSYQTGRQLRSRAILKPARFGGTPCGLLFEERSCHGRTIC